MTIFHLDFETRWSVHNSLSKMSMINYVCGPLFHVHMMGVAKDNEPVEVLNNAQIPEYLGDHQVSKHTIQAYNAPFEALILNMHYGVKPKYIIDTLAMSRAFLPPVLASHQLKFVGAALGLPPKGDELNLSKNLDFLPTDIYNQVAEYCKNDVFISRGIYYALQSQLTPHHMLLIDLYTRMVSEPSLELDASLARILYKNTEEKRDAIAKMLYDNYGITPDQLTSNQKLGSLLLQCGVSPPSKISKTTGLQTFAMAKTDEGFVRLKNHPKKKIRVLIKAREVFKSNNEFKRLEAYIAAAQVNDKWPVGINYAGARQTKRTSGNSAGGGNPQNLNRGSGLRDLILAPKGQVLVVADSKNIELRVARTLAGCHDEIDKLHKGHDLYKAMAAVIFGTTYDEVTDDQRFVGKTAELSLQYSSGPDTFNGMCRNSGIHLYDLGLNARTIVHQWRTKWHKVKHLWKHSEWLMSHKPETRERAFLELCYQAGLSYPYIIKDDHPNVPLPDGLHIDYCDFMSMNGERNNSYLTSGRRDHLYGGKIMQHWSQALANCVIQWQIAQMLYAGIRPAMFVHDEVVVIADENEAEQIKNRVQKHMRQAPPWWSGLQLDVDAKINRIYGKAK